MHSNYGRTVIKSIEKYIIVPVNTLE